MEHETIWEDKPELFLKINLIHENWGDTFFTSDTDRDNSELV